MASESNVPTKVSSFVARLLSAPNEATFRRMLGVVLGGGGATALSGLSDVTIAAPTNGQALKYDSGTGKFTNQADATGGSGVTTTVRSASWTEAATSGLAVALVNAAGGAIVATLPTAVGNTAIITIKKTDASANAVTVDGAAAETIDGGTTAVLTRENESISLVSDNVNWRII
jgi:hypothetical protein